MNGEQRMVFVVISTNFTSELFRVRSKVPFFCRTTKKEGYADRQEKVREKRVPRYYWLSLPLGLFVLSNTNACSSAETREFVPLDTHILYHEEEQLTYSNALVYISFVYMYTRTHTHTKRHTTHVNA